MQPWRKRVNWKSSLVRLNTVAKRPNARSLLPGTSVVGNGAFLKGVLRERSLQEKPGPSIATEFGVLLPGVQ
jgi:hypothetical protein